MQRLPTQPWLPAPRTSTWTSCLVLALCAALASGCGTDSGEGDGGGSSSGGASGGGSACDKQGAGTGIDLRADMQVFNAGQSVKSGSTINVAAGGIDAGTAVDTTLSIQNVKQADLALELKVTGVSISYTKPEGASDNGKPFECLVDDGTGTLVDCADADLGSVTPPGADASFCTTGTARKSLDVVVRFKKQDDEIVRRVVLSVFVQNDEEFDGKPYRVTFSTKVGAPKAVVPNLVELGTAKLGEATPKKFNITNAGEAPLLVSKLDITPNNGKPIEVEIGGKTYKGGSVAVFEPPISVDPQKSEPVIVTYTATSPAPYQDVIHVWTNDKGGTKKDGRHSVSVLANQKVPCLKIIPATQVNFGFVPIGTEGSRKVILQSCGDADVRVTGLDLGDDKDDIFKLNTADVKGLGGKPVSEDNAIVLKTNEQVTVEVLCSPEEEKKDKDGKPAAYTASIGVADNTIQQDKKIALSCWGTKTNCPTPVIVSQEGEEIIPQQELNLVGAQSFAGPNQKVDKWKWTVLKQPKGSGDHKFWPNAGAPDVKFGAKTSKDGTDYITVNIAGEYVFQLEVWDDAGNEGCVAAKQTILVIPDQAIHVELLWDTPGDLDKLDSGLGNGSDMDLHFAHPSAAASKICKTPAEMCGVNPCKCQDDLDKDGKADPWFHGLYDVFWFNAAPNWGSQDPTVQDNPTLDLDDTDGWGPENLNLKEPENNKVYRVGVHYWDNHDYGDSTANVRIYILGVLKADMTSTVMSECDFWWVKDIEWPSGKLLDVSGGTANGKITKGYSPKFAKSLGGKCK